MSSDLKRNLLIRFSYYYGLVNSCPPENTYTASIIPAWMPISVLSLDASAKCLLVVCLLTPLIFRIMISIENKLSIKEDESRTLDAIILQSELQSCSYFLCFKENRRRPEHEVCPSWIEAFLNISSSRSSGRLKGKAWFGVFLMDGPAERNSGPFCS